MTVERLKTGRNGEEEEEIAEWQWARGGRDLQTNLITSLKNGIIFQALEWFSSFKESEKD